MNAIALAAALTVALLGQDPESIVQREELSPPGEAQSAPPVPVADPVEAGSVRQTHERPQSGRSVAAFWFVD